MTICLFWGESRSPNVMPTILGVIPLSAIRQLMSWSLYWQRQEEDPLYLIIKIELEGAIHFFGEGKKMWVATLKSLARPIVLRKRSRSTRIWITDAKLFEPSKHLDYILPPKRSTWTSSLRRGVWIMICFCSECAIYISLPVLLQVVTICLHFSL